jgi:hypothetical protein
VRLRSCEPVRPGDNGAVTDFGPELLNWATVTLRPDAAWSMREDRAITRWAWRFRQRIDMGPPMDDEGTWATRVTAVTPLVSGVEDGERALALVAAANRVASLSAAVLEPTTGTVALACAAWVRQANKPWLLTVLGAAISLQLAVPEASDPEAFAVGFGGRADLAPHPLSGPRGERDPSLDIVARAQQAGLAPSRILPRDFRVAVGDLSSLRIPASADGAHLELGADTFNLGGPARIVLESAVHPGFGTGLLAVLRVPLSGGEAGPERLANDLNRHELADRVGGSTFGAWSADEAGLAHVAFLPNHVLPRSEPDRRARLVNCVLDEIGRLQWLDAAWGGDAPEGDAGLG